MKGENNMINGKLKYSESTIKEIKDNMNYSKATMTGFYENLLKLKTDIEKFYDDNMFYLGYELSEAGYHGWSYEHTKDMKEIDKDICQKFKEIYAIILCGIGEEI
jgi:hypothetical protein